MKTKSQENWRTGDGPRRQGVGPGVNDVAKNASLASPTWQIITPRVVIGGSTISVLLTSPHPFYRVLCVASPPVLFNHFILLSSLLTWLNVNVNVKTLLRSLLLEHISIPFLRSHSRTCFFPMLLKHSNAVIQVWRLWIYNGSKNFQSRVSWMSKLVHWLLWPLFC